MLSCLDWAKSYGSIRGFSPVLCNVLVLMAQPVSAVWEYLEADFPSDILAAFYS